MYNYTCHSYNLLLSNIQQKLLIIKPIAFLFLSTYQSRITPHCLKRLTCFVTSLLNNATGIAVILVACVLSTLSKCTVILPFNFKQESKYTYFPLQLLTKAATKAATPIPP